MFLDALFDTLKIMPLLALVYGILTWIEPHLRTNPSPRTPFGPFLGALAGCVPQCEFSAAYATLYHGGRVGGGTLIAVFLATSDEAIPILLAHSDQGTTIIVLIICKIAIAIFWGYLFASTVFRHQRLQPGPGSDANSCRHPHANLLTTVLAQTLKISALIFVTLIVLDGAMALIGPERLGNLFLAHNSWQPVLTALIGLIPSCATSVFLTELYLNGTIGFGAALAGLSAGAGLGYIILFQDKSHRKAAWQILGYTYLASTLSGLALQFFLG